MHCIIELSPYGIIERDIKKYPIGATSHVTMCMGPILRLGIYCLMYVHMCVYVLCVHIIAMCKLALYSEV